MEIAPRKPYAVIPVKLPSTRPALSSPPSTSPPRALRCHPHRQPPLHAPYAVIPTGVAGSCRSRSGGIVARTQPWQDRRVFELCNETTAFLPRPQRRAAAVCSHQPRLDVSYAVIPTVNLRSTCLTLSSRPSTSPPRVLRCHPDRSGRLLPVTQRRDRGKNSALARPTCLRTV